MRLEFATSLLGPDPRYPGDSIIIETTQPELDGLAPATWVGTLVRALCAELQPDYAFANSMAEAMAQGLKFGRSSRHLAWLTFFGERELRSLDMPRLERIPGLLVDPVGAGVLLRMGEPPKRTYDSYLRILEAVEQSVGVDRVAAIFERGGRTKSGFPVPGSVPEAPPRPVPGYQPVPLPTVTRVGPSFEHIAGRRYEAIRVGQLDYRKPGGVIDGFEAVGCEFDNVSLGAVHPREEPVVVRNSRLEKCRLRLAILRFVRIEDCIVDGCKGSALYPTTGPLLKHVVVRGNIDALHVNSLKRLRKDPQAIARHHEFYRQVDWALDITQAAFARCELEGVPGRLVRRDPATQILITRERVSGSRWREATSGSIEAVSVERFLEGDEESVVLVACSRSKRFQESLVTFDRLRAAGIAEPD